MGAELSYYIGPYLRIKQPVEVEKVMGKRCRLVACRYYAGGAHELKKDWTTCPKCSTALEDYEREIGRPKATINYREVLDREDIFSHMDAEYGDRDVVLLTPNICNEALVEEKISRMGTTLGRDMHFDKHQTGSMVLDDQMIVREKCWFVDKYAKEIAQLKEAFGEDNVHQLWGWCGDMS